MALAVVAPGLAIQRLLRLRIDAALVLPLGMAFAATTSWLSLCAGRPWLFPLAVGVADLGLLWPVLPWRRAPGPRLRGAAWPFLAIVAVLAITQYPLNRRTATGEFLLDDLERIDTAFHVGVTWELAAGYPPQVPGLAGVPLGYHVGPHLIRAAAYRWAGIHPYDALYRFDVTLWALALVLALRGATAAVGGSDLAVRLVPWTLLATDFSFAFGLLRPDVHWWTELFRGNLLLSLIFANSLIPALALALGVIIALSRSRDEGAGGWTLVAAALALAVPFFKVFLAAQLLAGLGAAVLLRRSRRTSLVVLVPALLATLALALGQGGNSVQVLFDPLAPAALSREMLQLSPLFGFGLAAWGAAWLVASLGLRLVGLPAAIRALGSGEAARVALAVMALSGWPLALLVRVTADGTFNESVYFTVQSGALLWLFAALTSAECATSSWRRVGLVAAALLLAFPSTVELVWRKATTPPEVVPARVVKAMDVLEKASRLGDVVLTRPFSRYPPPPIVLVGRRVPYTHYMPYMRQFAPADALREREQAVRDFFRTSDPGAARAIARRLGARFVYLFGPQSIAPEVEAGLRTLYADEGTRLYQIPED